jgi:hypothetical protein
MTKQIHLAAHFPGVNNTTVWSDPEAVSCGSRTSRTTSSSVPISPGPAGPRSRRAVTPSAARRRVSNARHSMTEFFPDTRSVNSTPCTTQRYR